MDRIQIFLCVCLVVSSVKHVQSSEEDIYRRLDQSGKESESLINKVPGERRASEPDYNSSSSTSSVRNETSPVDVPTGTTFKVLDARREKVPDGFMFTVRYWTDGQHPVYAVWREYMSLSHVRLDDLEDDTSDMTGPGLRETRVLISHGHELNKHHNLWLEIMYYNIETLFEFKIDGPDQVLSDVDLPALERRPPGDIVYQQGQDVSVKIASVEGGNKIHLKKNLIVLRPTGNRSLVVKYDFWDHQPFEDFISSSTTELSNSSEISLTFKTSKYPLRGLVILDYYDFADEDGMLRYNSRAEIVTLRSSNEIGPFPPGLLATHLKDTGQYENGTFVVKCTIQDKGGCSTVCFGVGVGVKRITINRYTTGGTKELVKSSTEVMYNNSLVALDVSLPDNKTGNVTYSCEVFAQDGKSSEETFEVQFVVKAGIVDGETRAVWVNDTAMELKCVFRSMNQPQSVKWRFRFGRHEAEVDVHDIRLVGDHKFSSTKYVFVDIKLFFRSALYGTSASCRVPGIESYSGDVLVHPPPRHYLFP